MVGKNNLPRYLNQTKEIMPSIPGIGIYWAIAEDVMQLGTLGADCLAKTNLFTPRHNF